VSDAAEESDTNFAVVLLLGLKAAFEELASDARCAGVTLQ